MKTIQIDYILAVSFIIGTALQAAMFFATLTLRRYANKTLDRAKEMSESADQMASDSEKIHQGAMLCMKLANELFFCKTPDDRANIIIKWVPKLQDAGIDLNEIDDIINS